MPLDDVRSVHLPYVIDRQADGTYVVLNREYKPIGFKTRDFVKYEDYPIGVKLPGLTPRVAAKISHNGSTDVNSIALYDDGCTPTGSAKYMAAYLERLSRFAKLKVEE